MFARQLIGDIAPCPRGRKVMRMEWPSAASAGDAVIVRQQDPSSGSRFVVHCSHGPQIACSTYAEAEARAGSYAEHARASVWYSENGQLQLVCSFIRVQARESDHLLNETLPPEPK